MSYFPLLIQYQDTMEQVQVQTPEAIESGRSFKVLQVNTNKETNCHEDS